MFPISTISWVVQDARAPAKQTKRYILTEIIHIFFHIYNKWLSSILERPVKNVADR
jgi:hypothetical protein